MKTNNNKSSNVTTEVEVPPRTYAHQGLPELSDGLEGRNRRECHTNTAGPVSPLLFSGKMWLAGESTILSTGRLPLRQSGSCHLCVEAAMVVELHPPHNCTFSNYL